MSYSEFHRRLAIINRRINLLCERWNTAKDNATAKAINADIGLELALAEDYTRIYSGRR